MSDDEVDRAVRPPALDEPSPPDDSPGESPSERHGEISPSRRRRRRLVIGAGILLLFVLGAAAWLLYTGIQARSELQSVRYDVATLRAQIAAGDLAGAEATASSLRAHADRAHDLTSGPVWATASAVPFLGAPLDTARSISSNVSAIADDALPALVDASQALDGKSLRRPDGSFDLTSIARVAPALDRALNTMQGATTSLDGSSGSTWVGSVNSARSELLSQLAPLTKTVQVADMAAHAVPELLGVDGPRSYFVSFENEAELRGLGGLPGAFAILRADHGRVTFTKFGSDQELVGVHSGLDFGFQYDALYAATPGSTYDYLNSDASPHFPHAAQIWQAMWERKTGQRVDGAIAIDPTALSYLLSVTGPAPLANGGTVTAGNVVRLTQQTAYERFGIKNRERKAFLLDIAKSVSKTLVGSTADPAAVVRAGARAVAEHRLLVWSSDRAVERDLAATPIGGTVPTTLSPYIGLAINNDGVNKLDYYLHASLSWTAVTCQGVRKVTVTLRLRNDAPPHLPAYVLGATGRPGFPQIAGVNRSTIQLFATEEANPQA